MGLDRISAGRSLADTAYDRLVAAILEGALAAGDRLVQDDLAEQLGISRTPVREALLRMERAGLVRASSGRGFVVPELTHTDLEQLYGLREAVEGHAARLVAERGGRAVERVAEALRDLAARTWPTGTDAYHANRLAHRAIVEAAGNDLLLEVYDDVWGRGVALRGWGDYYAAQPSVLDIEGDHADVLRALQASPAAAAEAMIDHVRQGLARHGSRPAGRA